MSEPKPGRDMMKTAGLAAVILLAPGGFILGATLLARRYRAKRAAAETKDASEQV